jgi:hypothetical protein
MIIQNLNSNTVPALLDGWPVDLVPGTFVETAKVLTFNGTNYMDIPGTNRMILIANGGVVLMDERMSPQKSFEFGMDTALLFGPVLFGVWVIRKAFRAVGSGDGS